VLNNCLLTCALAVANAGHLDVVSGARVIVFGSTKPWYESVAIALGAAYVATVEYLPVSFDYNRNGTRIETFLADDPALRHMRGSFDVAMSISSFEHDGLGRYVLAVACGSCSCSAPCHCIPHTTFARFSHDVSSGCSKSSPQIRRSHQRRR
jgi:hypothetical protein